MSEESDKSAQPSKRARVQPESEDERKTKNTEPGSYASRPLCRYPENASHSPIAVSMLGQRRRRWTNIDPALGQWLVLWGTCTCIMANWAGYKPSKSYVYLQAHQTWYVGSRLVYCWARVVAGGPTVNQRWTSVSCWLGEVDFNHCFSWIKRQAGKISPWLSQMIKFLPDNIELGRGGGGWNKMCGVKLKKI